MNSNLFGRIFVALASLAAAYVVAPVAHAGGPLIVIDGQAVRWARSEVRGGLLNSQTVDEQGRVQYRVDSGRLGSLSNDRAIRLVDRIFGLYTGVPTASIEFVNAGPIRDPDTGEVVNVDGSNAGKFLSSRNPTFQNPIIFDNDGSITGSGGVLGFFRILQLDADSKSLREAAVVLNSSIINEVGGEVPFLGVFTHEFGHFAGPLDHAQINGRIAGGSVSSPGLTQTQAYDLYAPFTETLYPFIFDGPSGSTLSNLGFANSGPFIATLDMDTENALSNLYPTDGYRDSRGGIEGQVLIRTFDGDIAVAGVNVVARRLDQGPHPPPPGTKAFPGDQVPLDSDNVPLSPPAQPATDSLTTVSSAVTGLEFGRGGYRIQGLPPGQYLIEIQEIDPKAVQGSGIGPLDRPLVIPIPEFYNGLAESGDPTDLATEFTPVSVAAGQVTSGIVIILNGISSAGELVTEQEPNDVKNRGQRLSLPVVVQGNADATDSSKLKMSLPDGTTDKIEDLYRITVDTEQVVFILLQPTSGTGDLDLYLFNTDVSKKKSSLDDPALL